MVNLLGNLAKILVLDSHANNLQVRTYLDIFFLNTMATSWQDLPRLSMFLIKLYQVSVHREAQKRSNPPMNRVKCEVAQTM